MTAATAVRVRDDVEPAPGGRRSSHRWHGQFLLLSAVWGSSFLFIKIGVGALASVQVALGRVGTTLDDLRPRCEACSLTGEEEALTELEEIEFLLGVRCLPLVFDLAEEASRFAHAQEVRTSSTPYCPASAAFGLYRAQTATSCAQAALGASSLSRSSDSTTCAGRTGRPPRTGRCTPSVVPPARCSHMRTRTRLTASHRYTCRSEARGYEVRPPVSGARPDRNDRLRQW